MITIIKMKLFNVNDRIAIVCEWKKTRTAFKHEAVLLIDGIERDKAKICYLNRTWEKYEYESVLKKLVDGAGCLSPEQKAACLVYIAKDHTDRSFFKTVAFAAKLGDVFCGTDKEANAWKKRMFEAGLKNQGFDIPADFDSLDEKTKKARLDAAIGVIE